MIESWNRKSNDRVVRTAWNIGGIGDVPVLSMRLETRGKSLLKIAYVIFVILESHDFSVNFL